MNLAIDIGNTRIKLGVYKNEHLVLRHIWEIWQFEELQRLATNHFIKNVILCNVGQEVPLQVLEFLQKDFFFLALNTETPLPIEIAYKTPQTLGKDRIAAVVGAFDMFPNENCLAIDAGTCITYEILTDAGVYLGGNIAPGLEMRLEAMHHFTAKLPLLQPGETESWIGYSTQSAMQNGAQLGLALEVEGYVERCRREFGNLNVIITGGDADFLKKELKSQLFVNPNLVLQGLNKILNYNAST